MGDRTVSSPVLANKLIYIGSQDRYLYAFTLNCTLKWRRQLSDEMNESAAVANGIVYVSTRDGQISALDAQTGKILWSQPKGGSTPFVENGVVYVGGSNLYALDAATGAEKWHYSIPGGLSAPFVLNGVVYLGSGGANSRLYALHADTGVLLRWEAISIRFPGSPPASSISARNIPPGMSTPSTVPLE